MTLSITWKRDYKGNRQIQETTEIVQARNDSDLDYSPKLPWSECLYPCPHCTSCIEILMLSKIVLAAGVLGKWLGHEGRAFMNEINVPVKETPESSLAPFCHVRILREVWNLEEGHPLTVLPQ